jgi:signal transduction histidine kinase
MTLERRATLREPIRKLMLSLDYEATLRALAEIALPDVGAWSIVDLLEPSGEIRRLAIVHSDPRMERLARSLQDGWPPAKEDPLGVPVVVRTGEPQIIPEISDVMLVQVAKSEENLATLRQLGIGSMLVVPLVGRDGVLGAITFVSSIQGHQYGERDLARAEELASLCALTVDHARLRQASDDARRVADETAAGAMRQKRDLEQILEIQARLVRGFSHDVKNPLGAAQGYAHLLEAGVIDDLTPRQRNSVVRIRSSITAAIQLIDDLVEYARNKTGKFDIRSEPVDIGALVEEIAGEYRAQVEAKGLKLDVKVEEGLPTLSSDRIRIRQILGNLLSNAVKYTASGSITLQVERRPLEAGADAAECIAASVVDTGTGISPEDHELVFKEFARLDPATTQGVGLGLSISQWIAEALGARITLTSAPGEGSDFTVWLPLNGSGPAPERRD